MRLTWLLFAFLLAIAFAQEDADAGAGDAGDEDRKEVLEVTADGEWKDSKEMMRAIQGINEDYVWIVQFHDNDPETTLATTVSDCLTNAQKLQDKSYQSLNYEVHSIDINNKRYRDAMDALGMTSNQFQATYPTALVMRRRKGMFAWGYDLGQAVCERLTEVADGNIDPYA
jgi:hypothetical protein